MSYIHNFIFLISYLVLCQQLPILFSWIFPFSFQYLWFFTFINQKRPSSKGSGCKNEKGKELGLRNFALGSQTRPVPATWPEGRDRWGPFVSGPGGGALLWLPAAPSFSSPLSRVHLCWPRPFFPVPPGLHGPTLTQGYPWLLSS